MKKLNYLLGFFIFAFVIVSCEPDDSLNPRAELVTAPYVFFEEEFAVIDAADIDNSYFGGTLIAPANINYKLEKLKVRPPQIGLTFTLPHHFLQVSKLQLQ
jgi:hypothetical protein